MASSISGVATYYAGGGGGGTYGGGTIGVGGVGGGANGGTKDAKQVTGGGGGGGLDNGTGGRGGSGLVIVRYLGTAPAVDLTTGLVGEWLFDSQDATDTSGNGFDGVITGSPSYAVGHNGSGYSIVMTGTEYATVPHDAALDLRTTFSISYWLKYTVDGNFTVMEKSPIYNAFGVGTFPPGCFSQTTPGRVDGPGGYNDGTWHHGCVTYDFATTTVKVYVDGSLRGQNTAASRPASTTTPLLIGSRSGSWGVQGGMDDLRIYNRVLTAGEIRALASM
ncbi:MAG: LamG domain-containing protein [Burkholderiales bacterium]|nr:LamG domain-containing protein [Burkholderiales bacterium]